MKRARELDMQSYFPELLQGFKTVYETKAGGYVETANNWEYSAKEMKIAIALANEGHKVYMLPRNNITSSPDMLIDEEISEIKQCSSLTSVDRQLRESIHQGSYITCLDITAALDEQKIKNTIKRRLERTENKIKKVMIYMKGRFI